MQQAGRQAGRQQAGRAGSEFGWPTCKPAKTTAERLLRQQHAAVMREVRPKRDRCARSAPPQAKTAREARSQQDEQANDEKSIKQNGTLKSQFFSGFARCLSRQPSPGGSVTASPHMFCRLGWLVVGWLVVGGGWLVGALVHTHTNKPYTPTPGQSVSQEAAAEQAAERKIL
jgi:hypothetical protein